MKKLAKSWSNTTPMEMPIPPIVELEYQEILQTLQFEKTVQQTNFKALVSTKANRWRFGVSTAVAIFCQISGNNIITYYLGTVLTTAGVTSVQTQLAINIGLSVFNLICASIGSIYMDKAGRRPAFLSSTIGMAILLIPVAVLTKYFINSPTEAASAIEITLIFLFYGCYSVVWTPLSYLYPIEVLSYSLRANGLAAFNGACYLAAFFNTYAIPYAMAWSSWGFYLITAFWCLVEAAIMYFYFPETQKMTLEEIDVIFDGVRHTDMDISLGEVFEGQELSIEKARAIGDASRESKEAAQQVGPVEVPQ